MADHHIRALEDLGEADAPRFGGKSAGLGELIDGGIPVPPGFGLSSDAYSEAVEAAGLAPMIGEQLAAHDPDDAAAVGEASEAIVAALREMPLPDVVREEICNRYELLAAAAGENEPPMAVRSSAIGEDSEEATFAGQQETFLWVRGADDVCAAVSKCWASLFTPEVISYRARLAAGGEQPAMGVTIQRMVDAAVAGVMFTCNPLSGDPSTVVVNASWGLGVAVVGGEVTPDEYRLSKITREVLQRTIGPKEIEYVPDPAGSGTLHADVPEERRGVACLEDAELAQLVDLAKQAERHFGSHQDLEWAIERDDRALRVLQSRPVTALPEQKPKAPVRSAMDLVMGTFGAAEGAKGADDGV